MFEFEYEWARKAMPRKAILNGKYYFSNHRRPLLTKTHDAGWVIRQEVVDLTFTGGYLKPGILTGIYSENTLTLTAEYATIIQLTEDYHELFEH